MGSRHFRIVLLPLMVLSTLAFAGCARKASGPIPSPPKLLTLEWEPIKEYLLIESRKELLSVRNGGKTIAEFSNLAFGSRGVGIKHKRRDEITPIGRFRVGWINRYSKFKIFIGLDYPNLEYAERGLREGVIKQQAYKKLLSALSRGKTPPQSTDLGGLIGIHGIGKGNLKIHRLVNWTDGCVALDNEQIEKLSGYVNPGMTVIIR